LLEHLVAVHVGKDLRGGGINVVVSEANSGRCGRPGGTDRILRQECDILAGTVLEHEGRAAGRANAWNAGGAKANACASGSRRAVG